MSIFLHIQGCSTNPVTPPFTFRPFICPPPPPNSLGPLVPDRRCRRRLNENDTESFLSCWALALFVVGFWDRGMLVVSLWPLLPLFFFNALVLPGRLFPHWLQLMRVGPFCATLSGLAPPMMTL